MVEEEFAACRICNEFTEQSNLIKLANVYATIVARINEVVGVKLITGTDIPSAICRQCNSDFETAQEFRRRCIESNIYFEAQNIKCEAESVKEEDMLLIPQPKSEDETEYAEEEHVEDSETYDNTESEEFEQNGDEVETPSSSPMRHKKPANVESQHSRKTPSKRKEKEKSNTPIICDICGNIFKRRHVWALHLRRHSNNKPYSCELCPSTFYTNSELKRHMRRHTGEKPYECQYCHRKFSDYGTHTKHERTHTNDRPFSCTQCDKSFSCAFVLKNHMLIHTGERAFRCEVCDKSFGRQHNLTTHMKSIYHQKNILKKTNEDKMA